MAVPTSEGCTLYTPDTLVSVHTNKPLPADTVHKTRLVFWCATCCCSFQSVMSAIQHMQGKAHKAKVGRSAQSQVEETNGSVQQHVKPAAAVTCDPNLKCELCEVTFSSAVNALGHFKGKKHLKRTHYKKDRDDAAYCQKHTEKKDNVATMSEEKPSDAKKAKIRCEDCDIEFTSSTIAIPHFKGKKHAGKIAKKMMDKQREINSARGRGLGQGWGSRGRGGFGRGYTGGNNYASNPSFTSNQPFNYASNPSFTSNQPYNSGSLPSSEYRTPPLTMGNYYSPGYNNNHENINSIY